MVVSGSSGNLGRSDLLRHLGQLQVIDRFVADRFISGEPIRILQRADESTARALAEKLRALGALVAVEPSPREFAMPSDISLMSLDGDEAPSPLPPVSTTEERPSSRPPPPPPQLSPPLARAERDIFSAPPVEAAPMELERPTPPPAPPPPLDAAPDERDHRADDNEAEWEPMPGRLLQGRLRKQPLVRLFAGMALGLLVGYLVAAPYADRAERRVAQLRAAANVDRYRPVDEARANAARLDIDADDLSSSAFVRTILIWLGTAGALMAGWLRIT